MNQIAHCDWLPERARWSYPARSGLPNVSLEKNFPRWPNDKSYSDQAFSVKMAGYWPWSFFASLWSSTPSRSINTQKEELGQYPAILTEKAWSITRIYCTSTVLIKFLSQDRKIKAIEQGWIMHYDCGDLEAWIL